ncbi:MAG: hypothetical protein N2505_00495 [Endomicrobia bacterium]|nr:hypothetical protein [Endomicrobiia bacterium]
MKRKIETFDFAKDIKEKIRKYGSLYLLTTLFIVMLVFFLREAEKENSFHFSTETTRNIEELEDRNIIATDTVEFNNRINESIILFSGITGHILNRLQTRGKYDVSSEDLLIDFQMQYYKHPLGNIYKNNLYTAIGQNIVYYNYKPIALCLINLSFDTTKPIILIRAFDDFGFKTSVEPYPQSMTMYVSPHNSKLDTEMIFLSGEELKKRGWYVYYLEQQLDDETKKIDDILKKMEDKYDEMLFSR